MFFFKPETLAVAEKWRSLRALGNVVVVEAQGPPPQIHPISNSTPPPATVIALGLDPPKVGLGQNCFQSKQPPYQQ